MSYETSDCTRHAALVRRYLFGECMVMADTLSRMYGVPMVGIHDDVWTDVPRHVGVMTGDRTYGDARGLRLERQAFLDGYAAAGTRIAPITGDEIRRIWGRRIGSWQVPESEIETLGLAQRSLAA
jgi:hypothetical protein